MSRRRAIRSLYSQHRTEWDFGWHDPNPKWRQELRTLYPVEYVAANHRQDTQLIATIGAAIEHRERLKALHRSVAAAVQARKVRLAQA